MSNSKSMVINFADPILLEKIDKLFASNVGEYISLPQLVVVGDQSSGKSSVLEGLTNLPFPRDSGLCTRFATQIIFRRANTTAISISIIPGGNSNDEHAESVRGWSKNDLNELTPKAFAEIMVEVHNIMGLKVGEGKSSRGTFSEDVLRLEITGPDQEHFSVVDVPGIFRVTTEGVTTEEDKMMVQSMVRRYMSNPRSIMLTVVPANVDIATQEILTMAKEADPDGHRTIGVLTKPDLVDGGAEVPVMDLVRGKRHRLTLGWCIVRNLGQKHLQSLTTDRGAQEAAFFRDAPHWNTLDKDRVGIDALRGRLQEILASNIRREFPKVKSEILKKLSASRQEVAKLGPKRDTAAEQSRFLLDMSMKFQDIVNSALSANYVGSHWFDEKPSLRFATEVVSRNEIVAETLQRHGHSYIFDSGLSGPPLKTVPSKHEDRNAFTNGDVASAQTSAKPEIKEEIVIRFQENTEFAGLDDLTESEDRAIAETSSDILPWLTRVYKTSRGFELGTFDSSILAKTMKSQSSNWELIALGYIKDVITLAHRFITDLLRLICPDLRMQESLISVLMDDLVVRYKDALDHVRFLLHVERTGTPATLNHYFNDTLEKSRQERIRANLKKQTIATNEHGFVVRMQDLVQTHPMSNVEHIIQEIHDILKSYYKVARKRFTDNLCMQAADYYLVTGPRSPLKLFSPSFVSRLTEGQLAEIAGEDGALRRKRGALMKEISGLEAGKSVLS